MKNYYDELEVNKNASTEVIEKVYKLLAKKYHPDTTKEIDKHAAEEKFKVISEAYEILSDDEKRKKYALELEQSNPIISYSEYLNVVNQRDSLNNELNNLKNTINQFRYNNTNDMPYNNSQNQYNQGTHSYTNNVNNMHNCTNHGTTNTNPNKKTYYYTNTGKPASTFEYIKYRIKEFFSNLILLFFSIIIAILIINAFSNFNLFSLFM